MAIINLGKLKECDTVTSASAPLDPPWYGCFVLKK